MNYSKGLLTINSQTTIPNLVFLKIFLLIPILKSRLISFSRNAAAVQGIGAVLKTASKVAQIDVTEVLDIEDNTTNLMDLSSDLLEELAKNGEKTNRKQIVIFEDYHFVEKDINNKDFVNALIKNHSKRTFFQKVYKVHI